MIRDHKANKHGQNWKAIPKKFCKFYPFIGLPLEGSQRVTVIYMKVCRQLMQCLIYKPDEMKQESLQRKSRSSSEELMML